MTDAPAATTAPCHVGIDVAKDHLDVCLHPGGERKQVPNTDAGLRELIAWLRGFAVAHIVLESTGGYETHAAAELAHVAFPVSVINARQVRDFARATGILAKTDQIDAAVLAHFAARMPLPQRALPTEQERELDALVTRRRQLVEMRAAEKNHFQAPRATRRVRADIQSLIQVLDKKIEALDKDIDDFIHQSPLWRQTEEVLRSLKGIGPVVSRTLIAELPELGRLSPKAIASLVGLAPFNCDSGSQRGLRRIAGGRASVRCALYMAAVTAVRFEARIKAFYDRLRLNGKSFKVAITACMRKILVILNARVREMFAENARRSPKTT